MNARTLVTVVLGVPFTLFSAWVVATHGVLAIFEVGVATPPGTQVFADLVISLLLLLTFIREDCVRRGAAFWPWLPATFALGSLAPLAYFAARAIADREAPVG